MIACCFRGGKGFIDPFANADDGRAVEGGFCGDAEERGHEEPPEHLFIRLADQVGVAVGLVRAGEPADIRVVPEVGGQGDTFRAEGRSLRSSRLGFGDGVRNFSDGLGLADAGFTEEDYLDASGDAPALFAFEAKGTEGLGERLAEAEAVEEVEGGLLRGLGVNGFGEQFKDAPAEQRTPNGSRGELRAGAGEHTTGSRGPGMGEGPLDDRHAHGGEETLAKDGGEERGAGGQ